MDAERNHPRDGALRDNELRRRATIRLFFHRGDSRNARRVQQREHEERICRRRRENRGQQAHIAAKQHRERRHDALFRHKAREQSRRCAPIAKAQRREQRRKHAADSRK